MITEQIGIAAVCVIGGPALGLRIVDSSLGTCATLRMLLLDEEQLLGRLR